MRLIVFSLLLLGAAASSANTVSLTPSTRLSRDGGVTISWDLPEGVAIELQRDTTPSFTQPRDLYSGYDHATVVTGLANGDYHFRARLHHQDGRVGGWSEPLVVSVVSHPSPYRTAGFFLGGAVVFIVTLLLIVSGARRVSRAE